MLCPALPAPWFADGAGGRAKLASFEENHRYPFWTLPPPMPASESSCVFTRAKACTVATFCVAYFIRNRLQIIIVAVALRMGVRSSKIIKLRGKSTVKYECELPILAIA